MGFVSPRRSCSFLLIVCLGLVSLPAVGCSAARATPDDREHPDAPPPDGIVRIPESSKPFVVAEPVGSNAADGTLRAPARVEFRDGAVSQLGSPLEGRVVTVHVHTGDRVQRGDSLVTLDCPTAAETRAAVDSTAASLREARAALERERRMLEEGVGIERDRLAAETKVVELEAEHARAQAAVAFVGTGSGTSVVIRAPMTGTVISRKANPGMAVQPGSEPLVEIGDPSTLWVVADVFDRDLSSVKPGATVRVEFASLHDSLEGAVASIGTVVSSGLRTAPVRITVPSNGTALRPGMYGRAEIAVTHTGGNLTLPIEAVLIKGRDTLVYLQKDPTTFERRAVVVAPPVNGRVQILSGLQPGERVVVRGALLLDGSADSLL